MTKDIKKKGFYFTDYYWDDGHFWRKGLMLMWGDRSESLIGKFFLEYFKYNPN